MRNALRVYARDLRRIGRAPKTWVILIGLIIVPALYAWVNIIAFWDPYGDAKEVAVAVVNLDEGASNPIAGEVNVGDQVIAQLETNDQLGWRFPDYDKAMHQVKAGEVYAAIVIPKDFSADLLSITTGDFVQPKLRYYTNEKANAIAPKLTDAGATGLETQVNATFVETVTQTVVEKARGLGIQIGDRLVGARDATLVQLDEAAAKVDRARDGLAELATTIAGGSAVVADSEAAITDVEDTLDDVRSSLSEAGSLADELQADLLNLDDALLDAYSSSTASVLSAAGTIRGAVAGVQSGLDDVARTLGTARDDVEAMLQVNESVLAKTREIAAGLPDGDPARVVLDAAIADLEEQVGADEALLETLDSSLKRVTAVADDVKSASDRLASEIERAKSATEGLRAAVGDAIPEMNHALSTVSAGMAGLSSALESQRALLGQTGDLLTGVEEQLAATAAPFDALEGNLTDVHDDLTTLRNDLAAVTSAQLLDQASVLSSLDPDRIASFLSSPVKVHQDALYPVPKYGSSMAPLFTNLTLWIGAFMLVILLRQEVDTQGVPGLTVRQAYFGRWLLVATLAFLQAVLVAVGDVLIGVQNVDPFAYVATVVFIGLVYVSIIFALAVSFGYIGKGLIIVLVIMQIPGGSGIYPIEMLPDFFRTLSPFFPFTYAIDALREVIGGFYGAYYWRYLAVLGVFAALAFVLGIFVRRRLGNTARLFNDNLRASGLFVIEDVRILGSRRRLDQVVRALTDRDRFLADSARHKRWYEQKHKTVLRIILAIGLALTAVLFVVGTVFPEHKATVLGLWALVCLGVIGSFVTVEYVRQNILYADEIGGMDGSELQAALAEEEAVITPGLELDRIAERDQ